jgi:hypothetical protein
MNMGRDKAGLGIVDRRTGSFFTFPFFLSCLDKFTYQYSLASNNAMYKDLNCCDRSAYKDHI